MSDRMIHASGLGIEVVRYNVAGKWYIEPIDKTRKRQLVTISKAVEMARWLVSNGGRWHPGCPGGKAFDHKMRTR